MMIRNEDFRELTLGQRMALFASEADRWERKWKHIKKAAHSAK